MTNAFAATFMSATEAMGFASSDAPRKPYPKMPDLLGRLCLIRPVEIIMVDAYKAKPGDPQVECGVADLIVLDGGTLNLKDKEGVEHAEEAPAKFIRMRFNNSSFIAAFKKSIAKANAPILGRIARMPQWSDVQEGKFVDGDHAAIEKALTDWITSGGNGAKPAFKWSLRNFAPTDVEIATDFLQKEAVEATASSLVEDPFA